MNGKKIVKLSLFSALAFLSVFTYLTFYKNPIYDEIEDYETVNFSSINTESLDYAIKNKINNEDYFMQDGEAKKCEAKPWMISLFTYSFDEKVNIKKLDEDYPFPDWNSGVVALIKTKDKKIWVLTTGFVVQKKQSKYLEIHTSPGPSLARRTTIAHDLICNH